MVIQIAEKMYCPVCENIPLDECQAGPCLEWKEEIRLQLARGESEQDIINSFVRRFGDSVVGIPQDPLLRALTLLVPILAAAAAMAAGAVALRRFTAGGSAKVDAEASPVSEAGDDAWRQRLEDDLRMRR